jgi:hypothetical protein
VEVARTVWSAANDTSNQLRYVVGADAIYMEQMRKTLSDEELFALMGKNFQQTG